MNKLAAAYIKCIKIFLATFLATPNLAVYSWAYLVLTLFCTMLLLD